MPEMDGFEVCQNLRSSTRTKHIPIIMLTAKSLSADKVVGLTSGADDYIIKPFDPIELVARVKSALAPSSRDEVPSTLSPSFRATCRCRKRSQSEWRWARPLLSCTSTSTTSRHSTTTTASCAATRSSRRSPRPSRRGSANAGGGFVGHVGGDDFVALVEPEISEGVAKSIISQWDETIPKLYDPADYTRGYIEVTDRRGQLHRFPVISVSVGIASNAKKAIRSHWEASEIATEMKQFAKRESGSSYALDRRAETPPEEAPPPPPAPARQ